MNQPYQTEEEIAVEQSEQTEYDWSNDSIRIVCATAIDNHPAYGLTFSEYKKRRWEFLNNDDKDTIRIGFRLPPFIGQISADMALSNGLPHYRMLILLVELGLIHFQRDYHDHYQIIRAIRSNMSTTLATEDARAHYEQARKYTIVMLNYSRDSKVLTPTVSEWLGNAVKDTAVYLNMSVSEFSYLCWCIGVSNSMRGDLQPAVQSEVDKVLKHFDFQIGMYTRFIETILDGMERTNTI